MTNRTPATITFNEVRPFGIEWEFDGPVDHTRESAVSLPLRRFCAQRINAIPGQVAKVEHYGHHDNNDVWICKPDGTCGVEVISPVLSGYKDLKNCGDVLACLHSNELTISNKCGMHIHISIQDIVDDTDVDTRKVMENITAWWIKFEHIALSASPAHRRGNRFCQSCEDYLRGSGVQMDANTTPHIAWMFNHITDERRLTLNMSLWNRSSAPRIEFRFGHMTWDTEEMKNRVRFLLWFVKIAKAMPAPPTLNWVSPKQAIRLFGLHESKNKALSPAMSSMKLWLLNALYNNSNDRREVDMVHDDLE